MEPTHNTSVWASYQLTDDLGITGGLVNNGGATPNANAGGGGTAGEVTASYTTLTA